MPQHRDLTLQNALRTWRLMAPRTSAEMDIAQKLASIEIARIPAATSDRDAEKAIIISLRAHEQSLRPRAQRTRQPRKDSAGS